ncbi:hypothetical protein K0M31_012864 [Melipona bicolor]|uniref:Aminotransferase class I/classII large domain-containing protein n=1 Tax=Melipona bicolor TaxID=60889 RepID=A0AA40FK63_9HYME|nr:hypothetical protein K0M31_012864 [Melipona bicolor]
MVLNMIAKIPEMMRKAPKSTATCIQFENVTVTQRAYGVPKHIFRHNDIKHLEELLSKGDKSVPKTVALETVRSMTEDLCDDAHKYNALTFVDEVHAIELYEYSEAAIEILASDKERSLRASHQKNVAHMKSILTAAGLQLAIAFSHYTDKTINYPTVPKEEEKLRLAPTPRYTQYMIDQFVKDILLIFHHVRESFHASIPTVWVQARTGKIYWFLSTLSRLASPETLGHKIGLCSKQTRPSTVD